MKAIARDEYGSPDVLRLEEIETPEPGDDQVLVRVRASSLNTADLDYLRGPPSVVRLFTGLRRPRQRLIGLDVAGTVEAVGKEVRGFVPGDEVWGDLSAFRYGAFAEYAVAPEPVLAAKPAGLTFEQAATVPHSAILAWQALRSKGPIRAGEAVLINGAGGCVGPFAIQLAKSFGAEVTGVDHSGKLEMMRKVGADHVIDYTQDDFTRNGQRYDLIVDVVGRRSTLAFRNSLGPQGRYAQIARNLSGFFEAATMGAIISMAGGKKMGVFNWRPSDRSDLDFLKSQLEMGRIEPLIDRQFRLADVPEALRFLEQGKARGKLVVTV